MKIEDFDVLDELWVPDMGLGGDTDQDNPACGFPARESEPDEADDEREEKSLWVPGRT